MDKIVSKLFDPMYAFTNYFGPRQLHNLLLNPGDKKEIDDFKVSYFDLKMDQIMDEFPHYFTKKFKRERIRRDISISLVKKMEKDGDRKE